MIYFARAQYLLLILLIPIFFIFYGVARKVRKKRVSKFGEPALVDKLTPLASKRKGWVKLIFLSLALLFLSVGMARPQLGATLKEKEIKGAEIMIALDVSNSMLAEDYSPNRLERAKLAISKLVDKLQGDRIGLIIFAGESFVQLPITSDYVSAKIFLNSINTESIPVQGTAIGDAIRTGIRSFTAESEGSRAIILITDGENHEDDPVAAAKDAADMGVRIFCIGVGSVEGKPIPVNGELLKDRDGNIVVTRLDEKTLRNIAKTGNGLYVRAGNSEFGFNPILEEIRNFDAKLYKSMVFEEYDEQYGYFFALALLFLVIELMISDTRNRRKLFGTSKASLIILFLLFFSFAGYGQNVGKEIRKGNKYFKKSNYKEAEVDYKRALESDTACAIAKYNLGNALYKSEGFSEAELYFKNLGDTLKNLSSERASDYYHNLGNLALKEKKYQEAVDAFKESLRLNPSIFATQSNLAYAQKMLKDQQQNPQQNPQQNRQNQDKNKDQNQNKDQNKNQDQNKNDNSDKNQQDQDQQKNNQQNKDQQNKQGEAPYEITPQAAQQMLQAMEDKEKATQEKVKKAKAQERKKKKKEKNW